MSQPKDKDCMNVYEKQDSYICGLQKSHLKQRETYRLKLKDWKKIFHANGGQNKAGVAILISDQIDLEIRTVKRDKVTDFIFWAPKSL